MDKEALEKLAIKKQDYLTNKKYNWSKLILFIVILLIIFYVYKFFYLDKKISVEVITVSNSYPYQSLSILNASGYVVADKKASVASKITGRLVSLYVEEGSKVKRGEIIAELESEDAKALYEQALSNLESAKEGVNFSKAELDEAEKDFNRIKVLFQKGFATQSEYDLAEARLKKAIASLKSAEANFNLAKANVKSAQVSLDYTKIRAPFDGVILTKNADVGDIITPLGSSANAKAAVVTMADLNTLYVEADVSEAYIDKIKKKQPCIITLDGIPDKIFNGYVHMIVPTVDRSKSSVVVKVRFIDRDVKILPDMSAKVSFLERPLKEEELQRKLIISKEAIKNENGRFYVFIVKNNFVEKREIFIEKEENNFFYVKEGIKAGERIVNKPPANLKDRSKIKIEA